MNGELIIVEDVAAAFSERFVAAFDARPNDEFTVALSGGPVARRCYEHLAAEAVDAVDWLKIDIYWGDERDVPLDHPESNYRLARESLLDRVGTARMVYPMEFEGGADAYHLRLGDLGAIDLIHLGLGTDGHTASLFTDSPALQADPGRLVVTNHDPTGDNPHQRMTLTFSGIARSRLAVVTVSGADVAPAMAAVAAGEDVPAARLNAPNLVWLVDHAAASMLPSS